MNIAVLGAGAMGCLFGSYLSKHNNVWLIGRDEKKQADLDRRGITVREKDGHEAHYSPHAAASCKSLPVMDLVIVFVKAAGTENVLETNKSLIGSNTYLLTLQNGAGHERKLLRFAREDRVVIGSTQHNGSMPEPGLVLHGGGGTTSIGLPFGKSAALSFLADAFTECGIDCTVSDEVKKQIWNKLFINTAASSLTAVLQVPIGFILDDPYACTLMEALLHEAVAVANAEGFASFDEAAVTASVKEVIANGRSGLTSIYNHVKTGQQTEVDTISGYVVERANALGIPVPYHKAVVALIHALENRNRSGIE